MAFWYIRQPRELLIDLDDYMRPAPTTTGVKAHWGEAFWRRRLRTAMKAAKLTVCQVWLVRSNTHRHWHAAILLGQPIPEFQALVWQFHLGSDLMRARSDLMRAALGIPSPSLLIRNTAIKGFYREPDRVCQCVRKHDTSEQYQLGDRACPTWRELRGMTPWELFGEPYHESEREVKLPEGEVPIELILKIVTE
jgi:hypothetical protein